MLAILREMADRPDGRIEYSKEQERDHVRVHQIELLVDCGLAQIAAGWRVDTTVVRITATGYDLLNALEVDPSSKIRLGEHLARGVRFVDAVNSILEFLGRLPS